MAKIKSKNVPSPTNPVTANPLKKSEYTIHSLPFTLSEGVLRFWKEGILFLLVGFALYHACISFDYVLDDKIVISENTYTKKGIDGIVDLLSTESFTGYFGEKKELVQGNRYRPLSLITFALEYEIMGQLNPELSHIINIFWYVLTCFLAFLILAMLLNNATSSHQQWWWSLPFIGGFLFLLHPIHTEAVANIKGRDEIMSMFFSLLALYFALRYHFSSTKKFLFIGLSGIMLFFGLLSKENAITFLAVIPFTIYFFTQSSFFTSLKSLGWLSIFAIAYLILRANTAGLPDFNQEINDLMNNPFLGMKKGEKFGSIMYSLGKYMQLLIFPHPLSHDYYPYAIPKTTIINAFAFLSLLAHIFLIIFAFKSIKSKNVLGYFAWFYLATISIVSNIIINIGTFMNERFIFVSSLGFTVALAFLLHQYLPRYFHKAKWAGMILTSIIIIGYGLKTYTRVPVWQDALSLNKSAVEATPGSARANSFMSTAIFEDMKITKDPDIKLAMLDRVEYYAKKAVDIVPNYNNANLMLTGVASERYKINKNIQAYTQLMREVILQRPDLPFIKEFSDYLESKGEYSDELFTYYLTVGQELTRMSDSRKTYAPNYLLYAYRIKPYDKSINQALSDAYTALGNQNLASRYQMAAQSIQ